MGMDVGSWSNLRYHHGISLERLRKTMKTSLGIAGLKAQI
jgi:hypothetical protein